jgi:hypothetical protein
MSRLPLQEGVRQGGAVVVTLFACRTKRDILLIWWLHRRVRPAVRARTRGFLGIHLYIDWRKRTVRSVSLWTDPAYLYDMGKVSDHIAVARVPRRRGIQTSCGIYTHEGECGEVMFRVEPLHKPAPLSDTLANPPVSPR